MTKSSNNYRCNHLDHGGHELMSAETETASGWIGRAALMAAALVFVAVLGLPSILYPLHADQAMFAYIGDVWLHGKLPYRDAWDIKAPGIFAIYSIAQLAFGRSMASGHIADLCATVLAAAGLFGLALRLGSGRTAVLAPMAFGIAYYTGFGYQETAQV